MFAMSPPSFPDLAARAAFVALAALAVVSVAPAELGAQSGEEPLITDRPDFTESTATVAPGRFQLEGGYTFARTGGLQSQTVGELLARIGAHDRVEIRVGANSFVVEDPDAGGPADSETGIEDVSLGTKITFVEEGADRPGVALLAASSIPTGGTFDTDGLRPTVLLAVSYALSERVSVGSNVAWSYEKDGSGSRFSRGSGSVALGVGLTEATGAYAELFGFTSEFDGGPETGFLNAGLTHLLSPDFQLDLRAGVGLNDPEPEYFVGAGASWRR